MITMPTDSRLDLVNLQKELDGATLYRAIADLERDPRLAEVYRRMAAAETRHAETFQARLREADVAPPVYRPSWRTRALVWIARRFGPSLVLPTVAAAEAADSASYRASAADQPFAADERSHARLLAHIRTTTTGGMAGEALARMEGRHRSAGGNALRAAVLGANDGLVSNLSLVMGVAGAALSGQAILITGLAGLLAGAISMALGEWLSVQSARELYASQLATERAEIAESPEEEAEELALIYLARGLPEDEALALARRIMADEAGALETLAREELGIDPDALGGSAWEAAITSFMLFAAGAIIPVAPFMAYAGTMAVAVSIALSTIGLFAIGAGITLFTGRGVPFSGARQVLFGLAAAAVTYGIGRLVGVNVGG